MESAPNSSGRSTVFFRIESSRIRPGAYLNLISVLYLTGVGIYFSMLRGMSEHPIFSNKSPSTFGSEITDYAFTFRNSTLVPSTHEFVFSTWNKKRGKQRIGYNLSVYQSVFICLYSARFR